MTAHAYTPAEVERIARQLGGARKNGGGWDCRCPAHDDQEPSLSLSVAEGGRLLWYCHTGCNQDKVLEGLRKRGVLLNGDAREASAGRDAPEIVYPYVDEQGKLLFEKIRRPPKRFSQRRPDGKGGHVYKLGDTRRVLYRLPEVRAAEEVIVCEGEKDADRLRSLRFVTTTNVEGASEDGKKPKWRAEYSAALKGKRLVLLPDNDDPGRAHMEHVARSCLAAGAASVKVIPLEGLRAKGDVSDWLDAGHTAAELRKMIAKTPAWTPGEPDWRSRLVLNEKGQPRPVEFNVALALRHDPAFAGKLKFNEFTCEAECTALPWRAGDGWRAWTDADDIELAMWCQERGIPAKPSTCANAAQAVAAKSPHHPVREYLNSLVWDGTERLNTWLVTYLGAKPEPGREKYLEQVGRKSLIQAVARADKPGCKVDHVPVLRGPEKIGKSTAIKVLAMREEWFSDEIADLGSKDAAQDLRGKWLNELAELSAVRRSDVERAKAFMSRSTDHYRPSYGRRSQDHPRQCVFWGTTNHDTYLQSDTGNRRNWDIGCTSIDLETLKRDRDQLWAEAVHAYKAGEKWWLDDETEKLAAEVQEERRTTDVWEGPVLGYVAGQEWVQVADVLSNKLGLPVERHDQKAANRVASILKAAGWKQKSRRVGPDKWSRVYVPPEPDPRGTDGDDTRRARCGETVHGTVHGKAQETQACERCERCERLYRESFGSREDDGDGEEDERDCAARIEFQASTAHTVHTVHSRGNAGFSRGRCGAETVHGPDGAAGTVHGREGWEGGCSDEPADDAEPEEFAL